MCTFQDLETFAAKNAAVAAKNQRSRRFVALGQWYYSQQTQFEHFRLYLSTYEFEHP